MKSLAIEIKGVVQGVGFRPFIYNLATKYSLNGWVNNSDTGVNICIEGDELAIESFIDDITQLAPPLSKIFEINCLERDIEGFNTFEIVKSKSNSNKTTIISPDIAICEDCIDDISDVNNPRFEYPFTNCTNCGPRYSIIKTVPYDRVNTSMDNFTLCRSCKKEYKDPSNRRYHAQPLSCRECGPTIQLLDKNGIKISKDNEALKDLAKLINEGSIVAIKGLGGFHIVCDATNDLAVEQLRQRKNRPTKPLAVMFKSLKQIKKYLTITPKEEEIINSKEKPITVVKSNSMGLSSFVAPNIDRVGCFIAYTPLHLLLFKYLSNPIVATSANLSGEPIIRFKDEILIKLDKVVDYVLDFNRDIINACDDSVVQVVNDELQILRNARGFAPSSFKLAKKLNKKILALGANQKSTISLAFDDTLIVSPHIADLDSISSMEYFERTIETFKRFYDFEPDLIVCDKHKNYESTKWAMKQNCEVVQIQHHHAHVLSTMCEYNLDEKVLAFSFDGTGFGEDGKIWGGEVLLASKKEYKRINHINYFKLLGGEKSIKEPKRVALSLLFDNYSLAEIRLLDLPLLKKFSYSEIGLYHKMWENDLNSPLTSSIGRVFDAIASFANIAHEQSYEGETGLKIEMFYDDVIKDSYTYELLEDKIDISPCIKQIVKDNDDKKICTKFINMLVDIIFDISTNYRGLPVVLTGGVFQNKTLLQLVTKKLNDNFIKVYYSKKIPLNDAGISVGQIYSQV
ncbi:MAG: carbamoyltransferase HypF [Halarcobacter sp.]